MISEKQRRRALARAKWERQQARRTAAEKRARVMRIIGGAAATVVVVVLVGWGVDHLVTNDSTSPSQQLPPDFPTYKTPTNPSFVTSFSPGTPTTAPTTGTGGTTKGSTATHSTTTHSTTRGQVRKTTPVTTGATGKASP